MSSPLRCSPPTPGTSSRSTVSSLREPAPLPPDAQHRALHRVGGPLQKNETRETLIECKRRLKRKPWVGLIWVDKTDDDGILAHCVVCRAEEAFVHNWQETEWAEGMMEAGPVLVETATERTAH